MTTTRKGTFGTSQMHDCVWLLFDHGSVEGVYVSEDAAEEAREEYIVNAPDEFEFDELMACYPIVRYSVEGGE